MDKKNSFFLGIKIDSKHSFHSNSYRATLVEPILFKDYYFWDFGLVESIVDSELAYKLGTSVQTAYFSVVHLTTGHKKKVLLEEQSFKDIQDLVRILSNASKKLDEGFEKSVSFNYYVKNNSVKVSLKENFNLTCSPCVNGFFDKIANYTFKNTEVLKDFKTSLYTPVFSLECGELTSQNSYCNQMVSSIRNINLTLSHNDAPLILSYGDTHYYPVTKSFIKDIVFEIRQIYGHPVIIEDLILILKIHFRYKG